MTKLTGFLLIIAIILGAFITFQIEEYRLTRKLSKAVEIAKKQAVSEAAYADTLKIVRSQLRNLIASSSARQDSMRYIIEKKNHVKEVIRSIHPEPLAPNELERILTNRFYYSSKLANR